MKIFVTSGGTGGHIYPAISLIKYLENNGEEVVFIGGKNQLEEELARKETINFFGLDLKKKKGIVNKINFIFKLFKAFLISIKLIKKYKPDVVIGFGNYISVPIVLAAKIKKIPIFLHEQNCIMGKANIFLGLFAKKIGYSIPLIKKYYKNKIVDVGNPRSNECLKVKDSSIKLDLKRNNILIFMGSLGSSTINKVLQKFINICNDNNVYHIVTGKKHYEHFIQEANIKTNINIYPYVDDMISLMKKCDIVVTRSGATTISEIVTLGIPSILIPSPYVTNNHQFYNANYLLNKGACLLLEEKKLTSYSLKEKIDFLLKNNELRIKIRINSLKLAIFDSNNRIYKIIKELNNEK